jgi:hypothetical protein
VVIVLMLIFLASRTDIDERHTAVKPLESPLLEARRRGGVGRRRKLC